jgi:hypothetical protein
MIVALSASLAAAQATQPTTRPLDIVQTRPATQPATAEFGDPQDLLKQLSSPDWHVRRQAGDRLARGGEDAKPFIRDLIQRATDDEARKNALAALARIDELRQVGPSFITLHVKNASAATVFAELSRQCFSPLPTLPENLWAESGFPKITLNVDRQPFWKVAPQLCQKLGVDFRPMPNGMRLMRSGGMQTDGIVKIEGPFLVVANQITYSRTRSLVAGRAEQTQFGMNFSVYCEPKLIVLRSSGMIQVDQAVDDHGNSMVPANDQITRGRNGFGFGGWNMYAPLKYPKSNPGTRIAKLRGSTTFVIQTASQTIEIRDLASLGQTVKVIAGMQVTFEDMKKNGDIWRLRFRVAQPNFGGPEWQQLIDGAQNRLQVLDADGNPLDHRGMSTSSNNATIDLALDFARGNRPDGRVIGEPVRLVWVVPTKTREISLPIEFDDLPMFDGK